MGIVLLTSLEARLEQAARLEQERLDQVAHLVRLEQERLDQVTHLVQRLDILEKELGINTIEGTTGPLGWLLSQPGLRERYHGKFVAISRVEEGFNIVHAADDLTTLLEQIEDLSAVYVHQVI